MMQVMCLWITYWEILLSTTIFQMKICGYRVITPHLNSRINILLVQPLVNLFRGSYVHLGLRGMLRERLMPCLVLVLRIFWERILTHHVFFNSFCEKVEYLAWKNPQYYYKKIPVESLVMTRQVDGNAMEITGCMEQHLIVFKPKEKVVCKEHLCDCTCCL